MRSAYRLFSLVVLLIGNTFADPPPAVLPGTKPLILNEPLDERMVRGINAYAVREIERAATRRHQRQRDYSSVQAYEQQADRSRERLRAIIGAIDERANPSGFQIEATIRNIDSESLAIAESDSCEIYSVRWPVLHGVTGEGLLLIPKHRQPIARLIAIPDADWTPESWIGLASADAKAPFALNLVQQGCEVLIPRLTSRDDEFSGHVDVRFTNQTHREFVYRTSFQVGRHVIGYEVQKVLAAVDQFAAGRDPDLPIGVMGVGEGGLLALHSASIDSRIDSTLVCGYFDRRDDVWQEPIYRNIWGLLTEFGDAELAAMIAPRSLTIEACGITEINGPPERRAGRRESAAPGIIRTPSIDRVRAEFDLARSHYVALQQPDKIQLVVSDDGNGPAATDKSLQKLLGGLGIERPLSSPPKLSLLREQPDSSIRQEQQVAELIEYSQSLVRRSALVRDAHWKKADRSSIPRWVETSQAFRDEFHNDVIGRLPEPTMPINARTRLVASEEAFDTYEVMLDVYPDVIAGGLLLLPKDLKPGEKRPVVVCQHGLEGTPQWTLEQHQGGFHDRGFSAELAERGFIVYAPQNPYRGRDEFRSIQRKSNPLKRSIFSYIIPQHRRTLANANIIQRMNADHAIRHSIDSYYRHLGLAITSR